ncbi:MAG: S8 family serine peptidase [Caldisericia bacterium]
MKNLKILLMFLLIFSMFSGVGSISGEETVQYVSRIVVLSEILDFYSAENLHNQTIKSQSGLISVLEEMSLTGDVIDYQPFWIQNWVSVTCKSSALNTIYNADGVEQIIPNIRIYADKMTSSKSVVSSNDTWNLEMIGADKIWEKGVTGEGAVIGVLDSGCDSTHPELEGKILQYGYIDGYGRKTSQKVATDSDGHGTSVCSVIAGETTGVAPDAKLIVGAVIPGGSGSMTQILGGMQWILNPDGDYKTDDAPKVVNMSFGAPGALKYLESGISNMIKIGILPIASAGNDGEGSTSNPGNFPDVISVGAVDFTETITDFSGGADVLWEDVDTVETVTKPDISAPGESIRVATPHRTYDLTDGTSSASPHVSGLCALLLSENPEMASEDLRHALMDNAKDLGKPGKDRRYGVGLVQGEESFYSTLEREPRNLSISWGNNTLWGDIEVKTSDRTYTVSRDMADDFSFLALPGTDISVSSFGFEETYVTGDEVTLSALPSFTLDLSAYSPDLNAMSPCKVRLPETPLPVFEGADGHVEITLPVGKHKVRVYSFGHSDEEIELDISDDLEIEVKLTTAKIAFIDDRKSVFGTPPEPIQGKMRRSLDSTELPYFIWTTRDGRVTASQLSRFEYVIWNLDGSPTDKIIKVLRGYMDLGGKLVLTSDFYGASYLGESDSTVFLASYFDCYPTDGGGSAIKHWDGENWNTVAIETPSFLRSTELVPLGDKAEPVFYYSGFEKQTVAGIKVSSIHNQGVILGFTVPVVSSDEKRSWLLNYLLNSFDDTSTFKTRIESGGVGLNGIAIVDGEQVEFTDGDLFIPHVPKNPVNARVISYGYDEKNINLDTSNIPEVITLEKSKISELRVNTNTDGYIIFHDVPIDPIKTDKNQTHNLPVGDYEVTFVSKGFVPQRIKVSVPGQLNVSLVSSPDYVLLPEGYTQIANTLSSLGLAHSSKDSIKAEDIVSSTVFLWSSSGKVKQSDRELISEIKIALKCGASVIIAGPRRLSNPLVIPLKSNQSPRRFLQFLAEES